MPDNQYPPTVKPGKISVDFSTLGKEVNNGLGLSAEAQQHLEELLELDRLMAKSTILNEADLTKKIGVIRGNRVTAGIWNLFAAMYTIGSNDGSCGITFETRKSPGHILERMRIDAAGNVGIGTSDPKAKLHVEATDRPTIIAQGNFGGLVSGSNGGHGVFGTNIYINSNNQLKTAGTHNANYGYAGMHSTWGNIHFYAAGGNTTENGSISPISRLFIRGGDGFVGIGTTAPKYQLDVNGTINASADVVVGGGDCAEEFDIVNAESIEPGTVMVIDNGGALKASEKAYDKRVAGVVSGAGDLRPGITLDKQANKANRLPLALTGKVYCKVDADCGAVEIGDLLTTSSTYGHAMKVGEHSRSLGAIIGKALRPLEAGCGLIPILVALQ